MMRLTMLALGLVAAICGIWLQIHINRLVGLAFYIPALIYFLWEVNDALRRMVR